MVPTILKKIIEGYENSLIFITFDKIFCDDIFCVCKSNNMFLNKMRNEIGSNTVPHQM